ncbi:MULTISPECIES: hypothetical protein [Methylobacterium]|nr:hypothetical protein [Methylobacterium sp. DB0501]NGM38473.1 hypothetical protein [Methylobacterium sp. DB0501]
MPLLPVESRPSGRGRAGQRRVVEPEVPAFMSPVPLREVVPVVSDFIS